MNKFRINDPDIRTDKRRKMITKLLREYVDNVGPTIKDLTNLFSCSEKIIEDVLRGDFKSQIDYRFAKFLGIKYSHFYNCYHRIDAPYKTHKMKNCLKCNKNFLSIGIQNRICSNCKTSKTWRWN